MAETCFAFLSAITFTLPNASIVLDTANAQVLLRYGISVRRKDVPWPGSGGQALMVKWDYGELGVPSRAEPTRSGSKKKQDIQSFAGDLIVTLLW